MKGENNGKIFRFDMAPSNIIFINSDSYKEHSEFDLNIAKTNRSSFASIRHAGKPTSETAIPTITLEFSCGDGEKDLCTEAEAAGIIASQMGGDGKWRIKTNVVPKEEKAVFRCTMQPLGVDFNSNYSARIHFSEIITKLLEGAVTVDILVENFTDVINNETSLTLFKYYPAFIKEFIAVPESVELGAETTLKWNAEGTKSCYIQGVGGVLESGARKIKVDRPLHYTFIATDYKGEVHFKECDVFVDRPEIQSFKGNTAIFWEGQSVELSWESSSASSLELSPGDYYTHEKKGSVTVMPKKSTTYELQAQGYDGKEPVRVKKNFDVEKTQWKKNGNCIFPAAGAADGYSRIIYEWNGGLLVYSGKKLYLSADGLTWKEKETKEFPAENEPQDYCTLLEDGKFYILGGRDGKEQGSRVLTCDLITGEWTNTLGPKPHNELWGAAAFCQGVGHHANLLTGNGVLFSRKNSQNAWYSCYYKSVGPSDAISLAVWRKELYLAARGTDGKVAVVSTGNFKEWAEEGVINQKKGGWFHLLVCGNTLYFLNEDGLRRNGNWELLPGAFPVETKDRAVYAGVVGTTVYLITQPKDPKEQGEVWTNYECG